MTDKNHLPGPAQGLPMPWPKALNVTRHADNSWHGDISFARYPTDDELKALHEFLRLNHEHAAQPPAAPVETEEDWRDDPSADERWNAGLDYGMVRFCQCLGVDPKDVRWDAATEELDGDVCAVIGNILRVKFGDDFDPAVSRSSAGTDKATKLVYVKRWRTLVELPKKYADEIVQALRAPARSDKDETGWLIEKDDPPVYCCLTDDYDEHWTSDASKALRFARREDAQAYSDHIGWTSPPVRVAEHMWPALEPMPLPEVPR